MSVGRKYLQKASTAKKSAAYYCQVALGILYEISVVYLSGEVIHLGWCWKYQSPQLFVQDLQHKLFQFLRFLSKPNSCTSMIFFHSHVKQMAFELQCSPNLKKSKSFE